MNTKMNTKISTKNYGEISPIEAIGHIMTDTEIRRIRTAGYKDTRSRWVNARDRSARLLGVDLRTAGDIIDEINIWLRI